jgi:hypothetical protein
MSSTALYKNTSAHDHSKQREEDGKGMTYRTRVHKWLDSVGKQARDITLPDLRLVSRNFEAHANLKITELTLEFVLLRVLTEPSLNSDEIHLSEIEESEEGENALGKRYRIARTIRLDATVHQRCGPDKRAD